ncbi:MULTISPECIES: VOC family protein [unclassified Pseudoxanthomonas]|uniref:VOC family protein n=1 Tax=unclassified Pseudoxanthomonas TaxID=2645906 RepID=UPI0030775E1C
MPEIVGIDHIYFTVSNLARSEAFYDVVLVDVLGFRKSGAFQLGDDPHVGYFNRLFGIVLRPARFAMHHQPYAPGLHHFCLRVESPDDVHEAAERLIAASIDATPARLCPEYADDYIATFFQDPDGIRLEVTNFRRERRERSQQWER